MGLRGPQPTPTALKLIQGNPGKRALNLSDGVNLPIEIPTPPKWLSVHAAKEWVRAGQELEENGLIAKVDTASFAIYCQSWGELCELELTFVAIKKAARAAAGNREDGLMDAYFQKTPTGFLREGALHKALVEMRGEVDKYARNFGLNPSARARVVASNNTQIDLPGLEAAPQMATGFAKFTSV